MKKIVLLLSLFSAIVIASGCTPLTSASNDSSSYRNEPQYRYGGAGGGSYGGHSH